MLMILFIHNIYPKCSYQKFKFAMKYKTTVEGYTLLPRKQLLFGQIQLTERLLITLLYPCMYWWFS